MRILNAVFLCLILSACSSTSGEKFSSNAARDIKPGVTTKQTVETLIGQPIQRTALANGDETWIYDYSTLDNTDAGGRAAASGGMTYAGMLVGSMLPVPGLAMGTAAVGSMATMQGSTTKNEKETLTITFKKGIVYSCVLQKLAVTMKTGGGFMFVPPSISQKTDSRDINCSDIGKKSETQTAQAEPARAQ